MLTTNPPRVNARFGVQWNARKRIWRQNCAELIGLQILEKDSCPLASSLRLGDSAVKIFFDTCKKHRLSQRAKSPLFIDQNAAFFIKIHEKNKSCQAHHALEIRGVTMLQWSLIFEM
jgi:hypothetical protein